MTDLDTLDPELDRTALEQMFPHGRYGAPLTWFAYVGRTQEQRLGLTARRVSHGPRGFAKLQSGIRRTRSTLSGEIAARPLEACR